MNHKKSPFSPSFFLYSISQKLRKVNIFSPWQHRFLPIFEEKISALLTRQALCAKITDCKKDIFPFRKGIFVMKPIVPAPLLIVIASFDPSGEGISHYTPEHPELLTDKTSPYYGEQWAMTKPADCYAKFFGRG